MKLEILSKILRYGLITSLLLFIILLFVYDVLIDTDSQFVISGYGLLIITYLLTMIILSNLNKRRIQNILTGNIPIEYLDNKEKSISSLICGYRESPEFFIECLESIYLNNHYLDKVILVVDGNNNEDEYMINIFKKIFHLNFKHIKLNDTSYNILMNLDKDKNKNKKQEFINNFKCNEKYICISQKHSGKRDAMYTGFLVSLINNIDLNITIDSDTIFEDDTVINLKNTFKDKRIGGVTGNLRIFNNNNIISYLSMLRYWFAFNLERAYGSYYGCVLCLSGPISCYRNSIFLNNNLLLDWINQEFLGKKCTFGDDRHLTNKVIEAGYQTVYNPYATAYTETPETINRFIKQQTRWTKSGYRELCWVIPFLYKHNILMTFDITYQLLYPLIITGLIIYTIFKMKYLTLITYIGLIFSISFLRSIYAVIMTGDWSFILFYNYSILYVSTIIPIKVYALCTLKDTTWGNIGRYNLNSNLYIEWSFILLWNIFLLIGFGLTFGFDNPNNNEIGILSSLFSIYCIGYLIIFLISKLNYTSIYKNIKNRNYNVEEFQNNIKILEFYEDIDV